MPVMRKISLTGIFRSTVCLMTGVLFFASSVFALQLNNGGTLNITEPAKDDLYLAGGDITVEQKVAGDLVIAGGSIDVFGDVAGDIIVAGGEVKIHGNVGDDVRAAGGSVSIQGNVGDDLVAAGGNVRLERGATVSGTVLAKGGVITLDGNVHENVLGTAKVLKIRGWIDGNVEAQAGFLSFSSSARVKGNLKYYSSTPAVIPEGVVSGAVEKTPSLFGKQYRMLGGFLSVVLIVGALWLFLSLTVLAFFFHLFVPQEMPRVAEDMRVHFWKNLGIGFASLVLIPVICALLIFTFIGLPLAFILGVVSIIVWIISAIPAGLFAANLLLRKPSRSGWWMFGRIVLGLLIYVVLGLIPVIGMLAVFILSLTAFGTFLRRRYEMFGFLKAKKYWEKA